MVEIKILQTLPSAEYELLDSGNGEKLERYGSVILSRPDPQVLWHKRLPETEWAKAQAQFSRSSEKAVWKIAHGTPERWPIELGGLKFWIRPTSFKHTGLFPEQSQNWKWIQENIVREKREEKIKVLNLFGYTGGATLAAAAAGAEVVHLDGSKVAMNWASDNAELSGLKDKPIRWILDDARTFVQREIKRGKKYDAIIMDPPSFGHGSKGEVWKIEEDLIDLLTLCKQILSEEPLFFLINGYASGYSALAYKNNLDELMKDYKGVSEIGELTIVESGKDARMLPAGIFARWSSTPR